MQDGVGAGWIAMVSLVLLVLRSFVAALQTRRHLVLENGPHAWVGLGHVWQQAECWRILVECAVLAEIRV